MAIEFRSAITIGGVNVAPGYPLLSGLTAGQFLRASTGTTVAFAALVANDLPAVLNAHGVRAAIGANADGLWVPWQSGDANSTFHAGGSNSSNDRIAVYGESYSSEGIRGASTSGIPIFGIRTDTSTNGSSSGLRISHRSSGSIVAGLGIEINFMLQSDTTPDMEVARISGVWTNATHISRSGDLLFGTTLSGTSATAMRLTSAAQLGIGITPTERLHLVSGGILLDSSGSLTANSEVSIGMKVTSGGGWARQFGWLATGGTSLGGFGAYGTIQVMNYLYIGTSYNAAIAHFYTNKTTALRVADGTVAAAFYAPWVSGDALTTSRFGSTNASNNQIAVTAFSYSATALYGVSTSASGAYGQSSSGVGVWGVSASGFGMIAERSDAGLATIPGVLQLRHNSSGTPIAADFGLSLNFVLQSTTTASQDAAALIVAWSDPTHVSRTGYLAFQTVNGAASLAEKMRLTGLGQLLLRTTDATQSNGGFFPWVTADTLPALVAGSGGTHSTSGITARSGTGLALYAVSTTGIPFFGERLSSTLTNTTADLLIIKHTAAVAANVVAGYGVAINFQLSSNTTAGRTVAKISGLWSDPADATYTGDLAFLTANSTTIAEKMRLTGAGALWIGRSSGGLSGAGDLDVLGNVAIGGTFSLPTKTANFVYAGPVSGAAAVPAFRALVALDLPATAVTPGSYTNANITVDAAGRLTSAATGAVVSIPTSVVGYIPFYGTTTTLTSEAGLFWDTATDRLGIGTVAPHAAIHILGTNVAGLDLITGLKLDRLYGTVGDQMNLDFGDTTSSSSGAARIAVNAWAGGESAIVFFAQTAAGNGFTNEVMRIRGDGKVGIGVTAPAYNLSVVWSINSSAQGIQARNTNVGSAAYTPLYVGNDTDANGAGLLRNSAANTGYAGANALYLWTVGAHPVGIVTNNVLRLLVDSAGNVGVGTTAPSLQFESKMSSVYPAINIQEAGSSTRRATLGFGVNGTTANTGWIMGQGLANNTNKDFYLNDLTAGVTRLFIDASGFIGMGGVTAPAAGLDVMRPQAVQLRLASVAGSGTTMMAYSTGSDESLYLMVNRTYSASAFSRINASYAAWTLSMGTQDQDTFKIYRENTSSVTSTLFQVDASGNATTPKGGTIRADEATYAAPAAGAGLEIAATGGTGYVQSYNRSTSSWRPLTLNGTTIYFGGSSAKGNITAAGDLTIAGVLFPAGNASYYLTYGSSPAGLFVYGNLSCYHDIFPGNNNGTGGSLNGSYYIRGETNNAGIRTNGNFMVSGHVYGSGFAQMGGGLGTNHFQAYCSSGIVFQMFSGEPGVSYTNGVLAYNWCALNSGATGRANASYGGAFIRMTGAGVMELHTITTAGADFYGLGIGPAGNVSFPQKIYIGGSGTTPTYQIHLSTDSAGKPNGGSWTNSSDRRLKNPEGRYTRGLADLLLLQPERFSFNGKNGTPQDGVHAGFYAQDVERIVPEMVSEVAGEIDGAAAMIKQLNLSDHPLMLHNAIITLHQRIAELEARPTLRARVSAFFRRLAQRN